MPPIRQLLPYPVDDVDLASVYAYPEGLSRTWMRANMVASADGAALDAAGSSRGLSGTADRRVLALLRGLSDVILVGAGTARAESYRPVRPREVWTELRRGRPATPRIAVVTRTLDINPELLDAAPEARTLVLTPTPPSERHRATAEHCEIVPVATDAAGGVSAREVVAALAARGLYRVLCEGGPRLLGDVVSAGLLDELCLTVSPLLTGPGAPRVVAGEAGSTEGSTPDPVQGLQLAGLLTAQGALFTRYIRGETELDENQHA